jgi:hypothetical protein
VNGNQLADAARGGRSGIGRSFHRADIAADQHGDVPRSDVLLADQHHVCGFHHRIRRFNGSDQTARFHHSESVHA